MIVTSGSIVCSIIMASENASAQNAVEVLFVMAVTVVSCHVMSCELMLSQGVSCLVMRRVHVLHDLLAFIACAESCLNAQQSKRS